MLIRIEDSFSCCPIPKSNPFASPAKKIIPPTNIEMIYPSIQPNIDNPVALAVPAAK